MANQIPSRSPIAGGFLIAIGALAGALLGASRGQPTIGLLIGVGIGVVVAVAIWLLGRR